MQHITLEIWFKNIFNGNIEISFDRKSHKDKFWTIKPGENAVMYKFKPVSELMQLMH